MNFTRLFFDVDLRRAFEGLREVAKGQSTPLTEHSTILFMNARMTAFKLLRANKYLVYFKNGNRKIPLDALQHLPEFFGGTQFEMSRAIEKSLRTKLNLEKAQ